jgi:hypothetical protein
MEGSGQLHASGALPPERASGTHWIGGWVDSRAGLDAVVKRKIPNSRRESKPRTPIVQPLALFIKIRIWAWEEIFDVYYVIIFPCGDPGIRIDPP